VQRCSVYEKNLMTAQERIQALEDEFGNMRAKMVKKLEDETDRRVQVGRQAAELQSQLQTRKNFFLTQSYQLRAAIERLGHDKKSFLTAAVRLSGVNKQGEEVRTAFTMFIEASHKAIAPASTRLPWRINC
jgi:L-serine deaminase